MNKASDNTCSGLKLTAVLVAAVLATGCISAKSAKNRPAEIAEGAPATPAVEPAVDSAPAPKPQLPSNWTVAKGDHLWGISAVKEVYNMPEQWPLLYKHNLDQIKDADLIYPGQVLDIPRNTSASEIDDAVSHAKNRGAWSVGPVEDSDKEYLRNSS